MIDLEAITSQENVIGCLLDSGATIANVEVMNNLPKDAFTDRFLKFAFMACRHLADSGIDIDVELVHDTMTRSTAKAGFAFDDQEKRLNHINVNTMANASITGHYNRLFKSHKLAVVRRSMIDISASIESGSDLDEKIDEVDNAVNSIRSIGQVYQTSHIKEMGQFYMDHLDEKMSDPGIRTGHAECDKFIGRVSPGHLIVIAARTGDGKTEFACDWAVDASLRQGKHILFLSMEMTKGEIMDRLVAINANVSPGDLDDPATIGGKYHGSGWARVSDSVGRLVNTNLNIHDEPGMTLAKCRRAIKETERKHGKLDMVFFDYFQIMRHPGAGGKLEELTEISMGLKVMAKDFKLPLVCIAQLNRNCVMQNREPEAHDIKSCGQLEQDADKILIIYTPNRDDQNGYNHELSKIIFAKARQGKRGAACLEFRDGHFYDTDKEFINQDEIKAKDKAAEEAKKSEQGETIKNRSWGK